MLEYLQKIKVSEEGDLVLIADAFEHWFQLSPQILISRYQEINKWANDHLQEKLGDPQKAAKMRQKVVFNSRKRCWPFVETDVLCTEAANSPAPKAMYETNGGTPAEMEQRQTFLDSNFIMGPVEEVRLLFERAQAKLHASSNKDLSEEEAFSEIWAEQEFHRQPILEPSLSPTDIQIPHPEFTPDSSTNYEFGIGLDYTNVVFPPYFRHSNEYPLDFLVFGNATLVNQTYKANRINLPPLLPTLHVDIAADNLPFSALAGTVSYADPEQGYLGPSSTKWEYVSLYTDLWTGITPVIIPQGSPSSSQAYPQSTELEDTHHEIWFQPLARKLLDAVLQTPEGGPVAIEGKHGHGRKWFSPMSRSKFKNKGGFGVSMDGRGGGLFGWEDICDEKIQEEVFADGKGKWVWEGGGGQEGGKGSGSVGMAEAR